MDPLRHLSDEELLRRLRAGEQAAFDVLHERYRLRLQTYATRLLRSSHDAEDVLQDVFVRAHELLATGEREIRLGPWLHRLVHNRCIDVLRARQAGLAPQLDAEALDAMPDRRADPAESAARAERLREVVSGVQSLSERQRAALVLSAVDGRSHEEIAQRLDINVGASKSLVMRARVALQRAAAALGAPFHRLIGDPHPVAVAGVVAAVAAPAVLIGPGRIVTERVIGPGDPAPRTQARHEKGQPLPAGLAFHEARVELPAGEARPRMRTLRLTCPSGTVFAGGFSAAGGPALDYNGFTGESRRGAGRSRTATVVFRPRPRLPRAEVVTIGIACQTPDVFRREQRAGRRLECRVLRAHARGGGRVDERLRRALRINCP